MGLYQHILVAVDFSKENQALLEKADRLAKLFDASLCLVHVVEFPGIVYDAEFPVPQEYELEQRMLDHAGRELQKMAAALSCGQVETLTRTGSPKYELRNLAEELDIDLILVGSHGRHGLQLLLGSTANGVLHFAPCDVLAVRVHD